MAGVVLSKARSYQLNRMHKTKRPAEGDVHKGQYWCTAGSARQYPANIGVSISTPLARLASILPIQESVLVHRWFGSVVSRQHGGATVYENRICLQVKLQKDNKKEANRSKKITTTTMITTLDWYWGVRQMTQEMLNSRSLIFYEVVGANIA